MRTERAFARLMNGQGHLTHRVVGSGAAYDAVSDNQGRGLVEIKRAEDTL